ncbi:hypothetical protein PAMA_013038 [Pampus argenteus]
MKREVGGCGLILVFLLSCTVQARSPPGPVIPQDCAEIQADSPQASSGVYVIQPRGLKKSFKVYCEMRPDGAWVVFQRRTGGEVSFNRRWLAYKNGFGNLTQDHWLGLQKVFLLTKKKTKNWTLRIDLWDHEGGTAFAEYKDFRLGNEKTAFKLHVRKYSGNAGTAGSTRLCFLSFSHYLSVESTFFPSDFHFFHHLLSAPTLKALRVTLFPLRS